MPYVDPEQQREYQRLWIAKRRAEWFADKRCVDCGAVENLELDHIDPAQKISHRIWSWSKARIATEAAKCLVRCAPCHEIKTTAAHEKSHGEAHSRRSAALILAVRASREAHGTPYRVLAKQFDIPCGTAWNFCNATWQHL